MGLDNGRKFPQINSLSFASRSHHSSSQGHDSNSRSFSVFPSSRLLWTLRLCGPNLSNPLYSSSRCRRDHPTSLPPAVGAIAPTSILPPIVGASRNLVPYADQHCGCDHDVLDILLKLQVDVEVFIPSFDGNHDPTEACNGIIAAIEVAIGLIVDLKIDGPLLNVGAIVEVLVAIIVSIAGACGKYGGAILIKLVLALDVHLARLVSSCHGLIPSLLGLVASLYVM
ncbi:hypothetical protein BS47DRAFT_568197 [Hydnum rufescens UP504]|uniref:Uncharacterized protein n=1 Tax=Hydnum rufescens UP504 TaxID=1448309 RepID=A0A9P6DZU0_9AGAM|nr:hypothetical protein BS47DRAFT_568197 [Hydnum rufescens UP504]